MNVYFLHMLKSVKKNIMQLYKGLEIIVPNEVTQPSKHEEEHKHASF